ncbi:MAG TPA: phospholipase D-like domain-containing protein, partial [Candidatus Kapabacteria bacterium]|nr:phospholipase D-like domain-containing protein [Candidatus Kapabacteria bacterium]
HAKTFAGDKRFVFVGSFNLDPRSVELNTEMGVVFESPELAGKMNEVFEHDLLDHAYRLDLDEDGDLNWTTGENGRKIRFDQEPETGWWQRLSTRVMSVFVIESML